MFERAKSRREGSEELCVQRRRRAEEVLRVEPWWGLMSLRASMDGRAERVER